MNDRDQMLSNFVLSGTPDVHRAFADLIAERDQLREANRREQRTADSAREARERAWTRIRELESGWDRLLAAMKYLRACAHLFPHVNTDREHEAVGLPDTALGAWCLGCTVAATVDQFGNLDRELLAGDDETLWDERARQWMAEYETRELQELTDD